MQFSCNQDTFAKYLNIVSRVVNSKPGLPILNNVLFETSNGKLTMTVTDLEIGIQTWIGAEVKADGKVTIPAKQLSEFVNSLPSEKIDANLEKQVFHINTLNNSAEFNTIAADDFPSVATVGNNKPLLKLSREDVLKAVNRVAFSAASDDIKPVLTGIRIEIKKDMVSFVSADGLRLSKQNIKLSGEVAEDMNLLIPVKAMQELAFVLGELGGDEKDMVDIFVIEDRNQVLFRFGDIDIVSRLIDGQYPEYQQIIPTGFGTKVVVSKDEFTNSLKITNIIARTVLGNKIILDMDSKGKKIIMSATQADVGSNMSEFPVSIEGDSLKMAFSSRFLGDMLNHIDGDELEFESSESVKPGVFKIKGDDSYIHLIMPMML